MKRLLASLFLAFSCQVQADDNVVVVLDASGSMSDSIKTTDGQRVSKMDAAKAVLKTTLLNLPKNTNVGILVFPHQGWVYQLGPVETTQLRNAINNIRPRGGTPLGKNMKIGVDALLEARKKNPYGVHRLLIVTDGEANDSYRVDENINLILARGIYVNTIGVAMSKDHQLATKSHSYANAKNPQALLEEVTTALESEITVDNKAGQEAFETVSLLPDESVNIILASVTQVQNQPLGEKPPVVVPDEDLNETSSSNVESTVDEGESAGSVIAFVFIVLCGVILLVFAVVLIISKAANI